MIGVNWLVGDNWLKIGVDWLLRDNTGEAMIGVILIGVNWMVDDSEGLQKKLVVTTHSHDNQFSGPLYKRAATNDTILIFNWWRALSPKRFAGPGDCCCLNEEEGA